MKININLFIFYLLESNFKNLTYKLISMNPKDKKIYKDVVKIVGNLKSGTIFDATELYSMCSEEGLSVKNMPVMINQIARRTNFIERLGNGYHIRTKKR